MVEILRTIASNTNVNEIGCNPACICPFEKGGDLNKNTYFLFLNHLIIIDAV